MWMSAPPHYSPNLRRGRRLCNDSAAAIVGASADRKATRQLRSNAATAGIPVIALTAHAMERDRITAAEVGCDDYETKPINFAQLELKIQRLLANRQPPA